MPHLQRRLGAASSFISTSTIAVRSSPFSLAGFVASIPSVLTLTFDLPWVWPPFFVGFVITVSLHVESNINFELKRSLNATNTDTYLSKISVEALPGGIRYLVFMSRITMTNAKIGQVKYNRASRGVTNKRQAGRPALQKRPRQNTALAYGRASLYSF